MTVEERAGRPRPTRQRPVPRWAEWAARTVPLTVLPSTLWRLALGFGVPVGFTGDLARLYAAPGWITVYVILLGIAGEAVALLALGLVRPWGEVVPTWLPRIGGRSVPVLAAVIPAMLGAGILIFMSVVSVLTWNGPENNGDPDAPHGVAGLVMTAAYAPMLAWGPLLALVTIAYWVRRGRTATGAAGSSMRPPDHHRAPGSTSTTFPRGEHRLEEHVDLSHAKPSAPATAVRAVDLWKTYGSGAAEVAALRGIDLALEAGRFTAIMGPSGSGKSTLMHCLAGLDAVSRGEVFIGDTPLNGLSDRQLTELRRTKVGFIFQQFNLLPTLTARENILLPLALARRGHDQEWFDRVVDAVGLRPRLAHRPSELSGGQQQRVACARALLTRPEVVFADEPTGNLDSRSSAEILDFLRMSVGDFRQTIVMVTHDPRAAAYASRVVFLADGQVVDDLLDPTEDAVLDKIKQLDTVGMAQPVEVS